jgi:hypothetical protein
MLQVSLRRHQRLKLVRRILMRLESHQASLE